MSVESKIRNNCKSSELVQLNFYVCYFLAYLQIEIDIYAGFYLAIGVFAIGALFGLPATIKTMTTPKVYKHDDVDVHVVQFTPLGYQWVRPSHH